MRKTVRVVESIPMALLAMNDVSTFGGSNCLIWTQPIRLLIKRIYSLHLS
jgi:hypothetical protein